MTGKGGIMKYIGIDGCRSGWFYVGLDESGHASFGVFRQLDELSGYMQDAAAVLVDIPIGLKSRDAAERLCDKQARAVLSPKKKPCVFRAPSRCAIDADSYAEANARNLACTGKGLAQQCFGIVPKIREMDIFLRSEPQRHKVREMHPEVAFWALNRRQSMRFSKKKAEGFEERMAIIAQHLPPAESLVESAMSTYMRKEVARDDIVDALVGVVLARQFKNLQRFPEAPEMDDTGVIMEIVYWGPGGEF